MFKRILKIIGIVLLGFALLVGGVVAFMAIRGDFKKQVIKPTAVNFSIEKTDLLLDSSVVEDPTFENGRIHSFTIKAEPLDVNVTECTLKLSAPLITFVKWDNDEKVWVKNATSTFHLNTPIYFVVNDVVDEVKGTYQVDEQDYYDGVLTITVKDKSGLLQDTLNLAIDRAVTSISFKDRGQESNNEISNGLFLYEEGKYNGTTNQELEAIEGEDYPLEVITAPLKASKPFSSGENQEAKKHEIFYVKDGQPRRLTHDGETVTLKVYDNEGNEIDDPAHTPCTFLKYDLEKDCYVFNSAQSGQYSFKLFTYPTYAIQKEIEEDENLSFVDKLNSEDAITKTVIITVNGSEAEDVTFDDDESTINMSLLKPNEWIVNGAPTAGMYNLGLTLSKSKNASGTEIVGRYNELKFLSNEHFSNNLIWQFSQDGNKTPIIVSFYLDRLGARKATISGFANIDNSLEYTVKLERRGVSDEYILTLTGEKDIDVGGDNIKEITTIKFMLISNEADGKVLFLKSADGGEADKNGIGYKSPVTILVADENNSSKYSAGLDLNVDIDSCLILGAEQSGNYAFKTIQTGIYLVITGCKDGSNATLINDDFISEIEDNGADSVITITPITPNLTDVKLWAIVVNSNGTWTYTKNCKNLTIVPKDTTINVVDSLDLPIIVGGGGLNYGEGIDVSDLVGIKTSGSYNQILMFAPKYSQLTQKTAPAEWKKGFEVYTYDGAGNYTKLIIDNEPYAQNTYYTKNNYEMIDIINYQDGGGIEYYLLGYIENGEFVNQVKQTGVNYYSKLYPMIVQTKYLKNSNRLQTVEEYVNELLTGKTASINASFDGGTVEIECDLSLITNRTIKKAGSAYIQASAQFSALKEYYVNNGGTYEKVDVDITNWDSENEYYEKVDIAKAVDVLGLVLVGDTANINTNLTYYTLSASTLTVSDYDIGSEDFINEWNSYYIIISHYVIDSVDYGETNIEITAYPCSNGIKLATQQQFTITMADYNDNITDKFDVSCAKFYTDNIITISSYYDLGSEGMISVDMAGTYFDGPETIDGDNYKVIAGHNTINTLDWNGKKVTEDKSIAKQVVSTTMKINSTCNDQVLSDIVSKLNVVAIEYASDNAKLGPINNTDRVFIDSIEHKNGENGLLYLSANVTIKDTVSSYIRFAWRYSHNSIEYEVLGPKVYTLSRNIGGYDIKIDKTMYTATLSRSEEAPNTYYKYDKENNLFTDVTGDESYNKDTYYVLSSVEYTGEVRYLVEIGYDTTESKYTYVVYAVDSDGNYLYYNDAGFKAVKDEYSNAFGLKTNGGWIAPNPFYALNPEYIIQGNTSLRFDEDNNIIFAQATTEFDKVSLQANLDADVTKEIYVKVQASEKFVWDWAGVNLTSDGSKFNISSNIYKYDTTAISGMLSINIDRFKVESLGEDKTYLYKVKVDADDKKYQIVEIANETESICEVRFDNSQSQWVITRTGWHIIELDIDFIGADKTEQKTFKFENPYTITRSITNKTTVIYSGTNFVLASQNDEDDAIYKFKVSAGNLSIKMSDGTEIKNDNVDYPGQWVLTVPFVEGETDYTFTIYHGEDEVDSFTLKVRPNVIITEDISNSIERDDFNNNTYDFTELVIKRYDTESDISYFSYGDNGLISFTETDKLSYEYQTFVDEDCTQLYTTNVVDIDNNKLTVNSPLSEIGTYFVKVDIIATLNNGKEDKAVKFGEVVFKISSKSQVTNPNNEGVEIIDIDANTKTSYDIDMLNEMFSLSRGEDVYYPVNKFVVTNTFEAGSTYEYKNGEYVPLSSDTGVTMYKIDTSAYIDGITYSKDENGKYVKIDGNNPDTIEIQMYYHKLNLTDILWFDTTNEYLEITYNYAGGVTLKQSVQYKYTEHNGEWITGGEYYYIDNNKYILAGSKQSGVTYYTREIIKNLTVTEGGESKTYKFIGTTYNMANFKYNMVKDKDTDKDCLSNADGTPLQTAIFGDNILYYVENSQSVIYCKQNAYIFENGDDLLVMSINSAGKMLYRFEKVLEEADFTEEESPTGDYYKKGADGTFTLAKGNFDKYVLTTTSSILGEFRGLELVYNSFGDNLATNSTIVETIEYGVELVFGDGANNTNIVSNNMYTIHVLPYKPDVKTNVLVSGIDYKLKTSEAITDAIFNISKTFEKDGKSTKYVKDIKFGAGAGYTITSQTSIAFNAKGNSYTAKIPVTVTYNDDTKYTYDVEFTIVNQQVVHINYPYNVDNSDLSAYTAFNASVEELKAIDSNLYNVNDLANWLGVDTTVENWQQNLRIKYDLALIGDTINLKEDLLRNINRYQVYIYKQPNTYTDGTYYKYNATTKVFEERVLTGEPADWSSLIYYTRETAETPISNIELVAISSSYENVNNLQNVVDCLAINGNTIAISQSLNSPAYVAFKVYAGEPGEHKEADPYGYYVLKLINDNQFNSLFGKLRRTKTISASTDSIKKIIKDDNTLSAFANIPYELIEGDYSNVHLFMIDSTGVHASGKAQFGKDVNGDGVINDEDKDGDGEIDDRITIENGQYISDDVKLIAQNKLQTITVAVVIQNQNGTSLVHVCNYKIIQKVNVTIDVDMSEDDNAENDLIKVVDADLYKYSTTLDYTKTEQIDFSKTIDDGGYITVDGPNGGGQPISIKYVDGDDGLSFDSDSGEIKLNGVEIATISGVILTIKQVSELVTFQLELTNSSGFSFELSVTLEPFRWKANSDNTTITIGEFKGGSFNNTLDLSTVFGTYTGAYTYKIDNNTANTVNSGDVGYGKLTLDTAGTYKVEITLNDVVPQVSKTITVVVLENINAQWNGGANPDNSIETTKYIDPSDDPKDPTILSNIGSILKVNVDATKSVKKIEIKSGDDATTYLTINSGKFTSVYFTLTDIDGNELKSDIPGAEAYKYFVDGELQADQVFDESGDLKFVHSAVNTKVRLNIVVTNYNEGTSYYKAVKKNGVETYTANRYYDISGKLLTGATYSGDFYSMEPVLAADEPFKPNTYYLEDGSDNYKLITGGYYTKTYSLYLTLPKTYELETTYRVKDATYETITNNKTLLLKAGEKLEDKSIDKNFFGSTSAVDIVNSARIAVKYNGKTKSTYSDFETLGLLSEGNPNRLISTDDYVGNGSANFMGFANASSCTLTLKNATTSIEYNFKVFDQDKTYDKVEFNKDLLQIDTNGDDKVDYISVTHNQLKAGIDLAYLQYLPNGEIEGQIGEVIATESGVAIDDVVYSFEQTAASSTHASKVVLGDNGLDSGTHEIEISIITMSGISGKVTLIVSDLDIGYGYGTPGEDYESVYAGTQIGTLYQTGSNGKTRIRYYADEYVKITTEADYNTEFTYNNVYTNPSAGVYVKLTVKDTWGKYDYYQRKIDTSTYTLDYIGAVNGNVSHWYMGVDPDYDRVNSDLVYYNTSSKIMASRSVASNTPVTMMFNVKDSVGRILGRIYYNLMLQNNIKIGLNPAWDTQSAVDLYLGSKIYDNNYKLIESQAEIDALHANQIYSYNKTNNEYEAQATKPTYRPNTYYTKTCTTTQIDLLQSNDDSTPKNYNNLFITLEQYSTNNVISEDNSTKALYNGTKDNSTLDINPVTRKVGNYLKFEIVTDNQEFRNKLKVVNGVLQVKGNPSGTFILKVSSVNGSDYGESFAINLHQYDNTTAQYADRINRKSGGGWASGEDIHLFKDAGWSSSTATDYAFDSFRQGYIKGVTEKISIIDPDKSEATVLYQVKTFDYSTSIAEIKDEENWDGVAEKLINEKEVSYTLPSVKYSSDTASTYYQIVSIRLTVTYNNCSEHYFAHYLVYNPDSIKLNTKYNDKVLEYGNSAWTGGSTITIMDLDGNGLYIAGTEINSEPSDWNTSDNYYEKVGSKYTKVPAPDFGGNYWTFTKENMTKTNWDTESNWYDLVYKNGDKYYNLGTKYVSKPDFNTLMSNCGEIYRADKKSDTPTDWDTKYNTYYKYYEDEADKWHYELYTREYESSKKYYKFNEVASNCDNYEFVIRKEDGTERPITDIKLNDDGKLTGTLPYKGRILPDGTEEDEVLFDSEAEITLIIRAKAGGSNVLEDEWTIKANNTIEPKSSMLLRDFFLISEINNPDYYNIPIIGIGTDYTNFVTVTTTATGDKVDDISLPNGYKLHKVEYVVDDSPSDVFGITEYYYVLVEHDNVISFNFNGGDYYINVNVDDNTEGMSENKAKINIVDFAKVWEYDGGFKPLISPSIKIDFADAKHNDFDISSTELSLIDIDKLTSNKFVNINVSYINGADTITRTIQVYFNVIINAKSLDSDKVDGADGVMPYSQVLKDAMAQDDNGTLTSDEIDSNLALKKELLSLIKFNSRDVATDNTTLSYYEIEVKTITGKNYFEIKYTYSNDVTYTRTLKIYNPEIEAVATDSDDIMAYTLNLTEAVNSDSDKTLTIDEINLNSDLKEELLGLIKFNNSTIGNTEVNKYDIKVERVYGANYYNITYTQNIINYSKTLKIYHSSIESYNMAYSENLFNAINGDVDRVLSIEEINENLALKKELLGLIKFNGDPINPDNTTLVGYFYISVTSKDDEGDDHYNITYTYNDNVITYSKTFGIPSSGS